MNSSITLPSPVLNLPMFPQSKWDREFLAFQQLLPGLLATHRGQFVAIHDGKVADCGDDKLALALRVLTQIGNVSIHVGLVTEEPEPVARSGMRREIRSGGGAP
jgi:hypothetical protein